MKKHIPYIADDLDDNEEVDVELTKIEIKGKQGNPSTFKYYHHMWSDLKNI